MLFYASIVLFGISVFIIFNAIFLDEDQYKANKKLEDVESKSEDLKKQDLLIRLTRPFFRRYVNPIVLGMKNRQKFKDKYKRKLASAGLSSVLTPEDFYSMKLFLIVAFPALYIFGREFMDIPEWELSFTPIVAGVGFYFPDIWIRGKIERRQTDIISSMPFIVDMLALSVEAGLDFIAAMGKVVEKSTPGPLTEEFETVLKEIKVGASRAEALRNLSWRVDMINISSFCATLIAADSVGASIGPILKTLSEEIRQKRSTEIEKKGARAATKLLFPMMFLIVPAVFMMMMAPMVLDFFK